MYVAEQFTDAESDILRRYFTNLDQPVFALVNLPEVVKGALFARYSRSSKSLRRLFLDEFVGELDVSGDLGVDATIGLRRAEELYERVFFDYGDDSVAQLGGVHLACEQASNLLTKVLEWGRLMSYLEQSTRYVAYDARLGGRYRYCRDPDIMRSPLGARYVADIDGMFESYSAALQQMNEYFRQRFPKAPGDSDFVHYRAVRAKSFDSVRGMLPTAALSNVGIYGSGQGYENLLLRMRAHLLPEVRAYADMMLVELRKVIPSFLKRVDVEDRGVAWSQYLRHTGGAMQALARELLGNGQAPPQDAPTVQLVDFDPEAEVKLVSSALYSYMDVPERSLRERAEAMTTEERLQVLRTYAGERGNRRHKPGRALETPSYRFDILCDYGAFRDLQRHRMLTIEWQRLTPGHGYSMPQSIDAAGLAGLFAETMERSAELYGALECDFPEQAAYAVALAYRIRFVMQMNAREAMHLIELRSGGQGHPAYRYVAQEMHRLIETAAGHRAIAAMMRFTDHSGEPELERLSAERRSAGRRLSAV